jgi:phospholipase C
MRCKKLAAYLAALSMTTTLVSPQAIAAALKTNDENTTTPIKHVIVIYGENRTFDHLFATYVPKSGETVRNLLSEGIINADGTPGPNFNKGTQNTATDTDTYRISPQKAGPYKILPPPSTDGAPQVQSDTSPPFKTGAEAENSTSALYPKDLRLLTIGATGLPKNKPDTRIPNVDSLPPGPFQLTPGIPYSAYAGSPVHRFYQSWQQLDCSVSQASDSNPSGCLMDLFPWVEETIGAGTNGAPLSGATSGEGAIAMGFYNMAQGDASYTKQLADAYTMSDNYHQPTQGGTGLDSIFAGFADALYYTDGKGNATTPPSSQIEDPNPQPGTNNVYSNDGYGSTTTGKGGSYSECTNTSNPGVGSVLSYLASLPYKLAPNCEVGHYYLLNNYNPGYLANGSTTPTTPFTIPPVSTPSIGDLLLANAISFTWFGEGWNQAVAEPTSPDLVYCNICNPFNYQTQFMADATQRETVNKDLMDFYDELYAGQLPAVSFVKPSSLNDGHPASSKWDVFEAFVKKVVSEVQKQPDIWKSTAIFVTVDEGGGYYDSGYVQPLDFFGDGPRIPLIVVSPHSQGGHIKHNYTDHVSILKFIEKNWGLSTISSRSRDRLPDPQQNEGSYVPTNSPAIGDLTDMFDFKSN